MSTCHVSTASLLAAVRGACARLPALPAACAWRADDNCNCTAQYYCYDYDANCSY